MSEFKASSADTSASRPEGTSILELLEEDDEFDTIGGLVLAKVGTVPEKGDVITITEEVTIEIIDSTPRTIKQLKIIYNEMKMKLIIKCYK